MFVDFGCKNEELAIIFGINNQLWRLLKQLFKHSILMERFHEL